MRNHRAQLIDISNQGQSPRSLALPSVEPDLRYFLPASAFAIASLHPSLTSAACSFMQSAIAFPGLASAQSFLTSGLHALLTAAARTIPTWQSADKSEKC